MSEVQTAVAIHDNEPRALAVPEDPVSRLFAMADSLTPDALERMVALAERVQDRQARHAFDEAFAAFQAECPVIRKNSLVDYPTNNGRRVQYRHASLDEIAKTVRPILHSHGLSYKWDSEQAPNAVKATCILRHVDGHSEQASFTASTAFKGDMNDAQRSAAALTYAKRQSLVQVLGITTAEDDVDGAQPADRGPAVTITDGQVARLRDLLETRGDPEQEGRILNLFGIDDLSELPAAKFESTVATLQRQIREAAS